ncbi:MAG: KDO2-lipid IV(A) lauroyltransferase [Candidatus Azotimanducaceae bacterium]|jgi:KDO2-lipid IV(A) lauroyltransferase
MRHTGMTVFETPAVWLSDLSRTSAWIGRVENEQLLDDAMASDHGTVVLLPHLGNWEMFNVYFASKGKMTALYHPPRQDWLKPLMAKVRGDNLVPTNRHGLATLYRELKNGQVVTVLPDQVPATGEFAPFFGQPALTDRLVPRMLGKTGARAIICIVYRESGKFHLRFDEVEPDVYDGDLSKALAALNLSVEKSIRTKLMQYQWEYKRFRERPAGLKKLYKFNGQPELYHQ